MENGVCYLERLYWDWLLYFDVGLGGVNGCGGVVDGEWRFWRWVYVYVCVFWVCYCVCGFGIVLYDEFGW